MKLVREGSTAIEFYNEGLVVFLYDNANSSSIAEANPTILEGFGEDDASDPTLGELAAAGVLVVFELQGDGSVLIELAVGDPLTEAEIGRGGWKVPVKTARLALPSGDLRVEGYNNLQFDPYTEEGEEGARVSISAGDYAMSLYHRDMLADGDDDEDSEYADEVIVLTPGAGSAVRVSAPMLRFATGTGDAGA